LLLSVCADPQGTIGGNLAGTHRRTSLTRKNLIINDIDPPVFRNSIEIDDIQFKILPQSTSNVMKLILQSIALVHHSLE
jgi:hypothetical protein